MFFQELASPFDSITQMNILQDRLSRLVNNIQDDRKKEFPPINVWASEEKIVVVAEYQASCRRHRCPGLQPDDDLEDKTRPGRSRRRAVVPQTRAWSWAVHSLYRITLCD